MRIQPKYCADLFQVELQLDELRISKILHNAKILCSALLVNGRSMCAQAKQNFRRLIKQYTATLSNDGAKVLFFDSLIKYYAMKYITQYSTRNKIWYYVIFLMQT